MKAVVGLRNPGSEYEGTRHNVGYEVLAVLADRHGARFKRSSRLRSQVAEARVGEERVALVVPLAYMNESGGPVQASVSYYKVALGDLLVLHDDIDLAFGRLRVQVGGGSGGHNGIRAIERALGAREFCRLKIGVGRPPERMDPADFVLSRFSRAERPEVDMTVGDAADVVEEWLVNPARAQERAAHRGKE